MSLEAGLPSPASDPGTISSDSGIAARFSSHAMSLGPTFGEKNLVDGNGLGPDRKWWPSGPSPVEHGAPSCSPNSAGTTMPATMVNASAKCDFMRDHSPFKGLRIPNCPASGECRCRSTGACQKFRWNDDLICVST